MLELVNNYSKINFCISVYLMLQNFEAAAILYFICVFHCLLKSLALRNLTGLCLYPNQTMEWIFSNLLYFTSDLDRTISSV